MNRSLFSLEHQCPQCGAPVSFTEADRIFVCPYCRVRHFLFTSGYYRYFLPPIKGGEEKIFYIPYWRFRGIRILIRGMNKKYEVVDRSFCAAPHHCIPPSVGFRSQTLNMRFIEPGMSDICFPTQTPLKDFIEKIKKVTHGLSPNDNSFGDFLPKSSLLQAGLRLFMLSGEKETVYDESPCEPYCELIGETTSIIYSPFFIKDSLLYDGVTAEKLGEAQGIDVSKCGGESFSKINFLPALCPDCGRDLQGGKESIMLLCAQCSRVYTPSSVGLVGEEFCVAWRASKADVWLPFWSITVECVNNRLSSAADFYRLTGIPKPILPVDERRPFRFMIPAFKANPNLFLKLAKVFTMQFVETERPSAVPLLFHSITLPKAEAFQSIPAFLVDIAPLKKRMIDLVRILSLSIKTSFLVFVPFTDNGMEFVQTECNFAVNKNALKGWEAV